MSESKLVVYPYDGKLFDVNALKFLEKELIGAYTELKRDNNRSAFFGTENEGLIANYGGFVFELKKDRSISISDAKGTVLKTIEDQDLDIKLDNTSGNIVFFSTSTGVISILRLVDQNGYRVLKYNEKGEQIGKWRIEHTQYTIKGNTRYSNPYLWYRSRTDKEIVFSSIHADLEKIIVLDHISGKDTISDGTLGGIILNKDLILEGLIINRNDRTTQVKIGESTWFIDNLYEHNTYNSVLKNGVLYVASYHWISTGSALDAYDIKTGKKLWRGDVKQLNASHSEYYNTVYLTEFEDKLILEGEEAYGKYLQILDAKTGKSLFCTIE